MKMLIIGSVIVKMGFHPTDHVQSNYLTENEAQS